jgi:hypothetical protein
VNLPSQPEPQSEVFENTAVGDAADAAGASQIAAVAARTPAARAVMRVRMRVTAASHRRMANY